MTSDVLLIIGDAGLRATIRKTVKNAGDGFRYLDEAAQGNLGLEKAYMLNPDIIILDAWPGMTNGYDIAKRLNEKNYLCKIIMIDRKRAQARSNLPKNISEILFVENLTAQSLCAALKKAVEFKISKTEGISKSLYTDILKCNLPTDFALINEKYNLKLNVGNSFYVISCKMLDKSISPNDFVVKQIDALNDILKQYHDGTVFCHDHLIYFILNQHRSIHALCNSLYTFIRKNTAVSIPIYFYMSNPAINLKDLQNKLIGGAQLIQYAFFNKQTEILFEDFIEQRRTHANDLNIDKLIRQIQHDIREGDLKCLIEDINDLFLHILKNKMAFDAYDYTCRRLGQIYSDIITLGSLTDTMVFSIAQNYYIEDAAQKMIVYYEHLFRAIHPEIEDHPLIQDALSYNSKKFFQQHLFARHRVPLEIKPLLYQRFVQAGHENQLYRISAAYTHTKGKGLPPGKQLQNL